MRALFIVAALGLAFSAGQGFAQSSPKMPTERPLSAEEITHIQTLDKLLAARDNDALVKTALQPSNPKMLIATLDWGKLRLFEGAGLTVALLQSRALWQVGTATNNASLRDTASLMALYGLLIVHADGVKCADKTAPTNRLQTILTNFRPQLDQLKRATPVAGHGPGDIALIMEKSLAPKRENDNYLCRGGIQEFADYLKAHPNADKESPSQNVPGQVGRNVVIPNDPAYEPAFLPMGEWGPLQFLAREKFPALVQKLTQG